MGIAVKLAVAIVGAVGAALVAGGGVKIYDNNKMNKTKAQWQNEKQELLTRIQEYQTIIQNKNKRISELETMVHSTQKRLEKTTKSLEETDILLEILNKRQQELKREIEERKYYQDEVENMKRRIA